MFEVAIVQTSFHKRSQLILGPVLDERTRAADGGGLRSWCRVEDGLELDPLGRGQRGRGVALDVGEKTAEAVASLEARRPLKPLEVALAQVRRPAGLEHAKGAGVVDLFLLRGGRFQKRDRVRRGLRGLKIGENLDQLRVHLSGPRGEMRLEPVDEPPRGCVVGPAEPVQYNLGHAKQVKLPGVVKRVPVEPVERREERVAKGGIRHGRPLISVRGVGGRNVHSAKRALSAARGFEAGARARPRQLDGSWASIATRAAQRMNRSWWPRKGQAASTAAGSRRP